MKPLYVLELPKEQSGGYDRATGAPYFTSARTLYFLTKEALIDQIKHEIESLEYSGMSIRTEFLEDGETDQAN